MIRGRLVSVAVLAALAAGCGSGGSDKAGGRAGAGHSQTLRLHTAAHGGYMALETRQRPRGFARAGFAKTDSLEDGSNSAAGMQDTLCFAAGLPGRQNCRVTLSLKRGTIVAEGVFGEAGGLSGTLPVVGGSGAYSGASGTYEASTPGPAAQVILVRLSLP
jgi:hypothetical protein